jgi:hypothetical protein
MVQWCVLEYFNLIVTMIMSGKIRTPQKITMAIPMFLRGSYSVIGSLGCELVIFKKSIHSDINISFLESKKFEAKGCHKK